VHVAEGELVDGAEDVADIVTGCDVVAVAGEEADLVGDAHEAVGHVVRGSPGLRIRSWTMLLWMTSKAMSCQDAARLSKLCALQCGSATLSECTMSNVGSVHCEESLPGVAVVEAASRVG
jgi:hypothetical protein